MFANSPPHRRHRRAAARWAPRPSTVSRRLAKWWEAGRRKLSENQADPTPVQPFTGQDTVASADTGLSASEAHSGGSTTSRCRAASSRSQHASRSVRRRTPTGWAPA